MSIRSTVTPFALAALLGVTGCDSLGGTDKVGETAKEVDATVAEHAADANTHQNLALDASQITTGTFAEARMPAEMTGAIAKNTTDIASHGIRLTDAEARLGTAETELVAADGRLDAAELEILNRVDLTGDVMTGTLQVPALVYTTPKTKIMSISPWAFTPEDSGTTWDGLVTDNAFRAITGGTLVMGGAVQFPDGVRLTSMSVHVYDNSATGFVRVKLRRTDSSANLDIGETGSTAAEIGGRRTATVALNHVVTNASGFVYWLIWTQNEAGTGGGGPGLYNVRITYTYAEP